MDSFRDTMVTVLVEVVLAVDGQYWRTRRELPAMPGIGTVLRVLDVFELDATVTGSTRPAVGDEDRTAAGAVLVHTMTTSQGGFGTELRRAGWHRLL